MTSETEAKKPPEYKPIELRRAIHVLDAKLGAESGDVWLAWCALRTAVFKAYQQRGEL